MHPLLAARSRAYLRDAVGYLGLAAALMPVGLVIHRSGRRPSPGLVLALSALPPLAATLIAAVAETRVGTPGQRRQGLMVVDAAAERPMPGQSLLRNALKIGLPWQLGHTVAVGAAFGGFERRDVVTVAATALVYPYLAAELVSLATGSGRALHDRASGTRVVYRPET